MKGSVTRINTATAEEIATIPGISKKSTEAILDFLNSRNGP